MSNIDWTKLVTKAQKEAQAAAEQRELDVAREVSWKNSEMLLISDQLLKLEDADPTAMPGTESQWRAYRVVLRTWVDGAQGYPNVSSRPVRP